MFQHPIDAEQMPHGDVMVCCIRGAINWSLNKTSSGALDGRTLEQQLLRYAHLRASKKWDGDKLELSTTGHNTGHNNTGHNEIRHNDTGTTILAQQYWTQQYWTQQYWTQQYWTQQYWTQQYWTQQYWIQKDKTQFCTQS